MTLLVFLKTSFILVIFFCLVKAFDLKITEISPYTKNERIEIYNAGDDDFSGPIELSGVKTKLLKIKNISLAPKQFIIIGDKIDFTGNFQVFSGMGFDIKDTEKINIILYSSGQVLDSFVYSGQDVSKIKFTIQKIFYLGDYIIKSTIKDYSNGLYSGFYANPGKIIVTDKIKISNPEEKSISSKKNEKAASKRIKIDSKNSSSKKIKLTSKTSKDTVSLSNFTKLQEENMLLKQRLTLTKNALSMTISEIKSKRYPIYKNGDFEKIQTAYKYLITLTGNAVQIGQVDVDISNIKEYLYISDFDLDVNLLDFNAKIYILVNDILFTNLPKISNELIPNLILLIQEFRGGNSSFWRTEPDISKLPDG